MAPNLFEPIREDEIDLHLSKAEYRISLVVHASSECHRTSVAQAQGSPIVLRTRQVGEGTNASLAERLIRRSVGEDPSHRHDRRRCEPRGPRKKNLPIRLNQECA